MKFLLILSLALVCLASVAFAAPSTANAPEDLKADRDKRSSDDTYNAAEEQQLAEAEKFFDAEQLQTEQRGTEDDEADSEEGDREKTSTSETDNVEDELATEKRTAKCNPRKIAGWMKKIKKCEKRPWKAGCPPWKIAIWKKIVEKCNGPQVVKEGKPQVEPQVEPEDEDNEEEERSISQPEIATGTRQSRANCNDRKIAKWTRKIEKCERNPRKAGCSPQKIAKWTNKLQNCEEEKRSFEELEINQDEVATRDRRKRSTSETDNVADELATVKRAPKCNDRNIAKWAKKIEKCEEKPWKVGCSYRKIATWKKRMQNCDVAEGTDEEKRSNDEQDPQISQEEVSTDTGSREGEEEEKITPMQETESEDTNGGYSCEKNSPCNIENIANEQFYFATASADKFIQCDARGGCHILTCEDGLVWDDFIKTCGRRA